MKRKNINESNVILKKHCCNTFKSKSDLKIFNCDEMYCYYTTKRNGHLKRHLWEVHNLGDLKTFKCDETGCEYLCKSNYNLKRHLRDKHNLGNFKNFKCNEVGCGYVCKTNGTLTVHRTHTHNLGDIKTFNCTKTGCDYTSKSNGNLKRHMMYNHNTGDLQTFSCDTDGCDFTTIRNGDLKKHMMYKHNIGSFETFNCVVDRCNYTSKIRRNLKRHLECMHDLGDKVCELLGCNVFKLHAYTDINAGKLKVCKKCFKKATGYSSTSEEQMVKYIEKDIRIAPYVISKDMILKGALCNTKRRPDMYISSSLDLHLLIECDENQHRSYNPSCEMGRMDELIDELPVGRKVFIRWNPDSYKVNGISGKKSRKERLKELTDLILYVTRKTDWQDHENVVVYYMYYSDNNENISTRHVLVKTY